MQPPTARAARSRRTIVRGGPIAAALLALALGGCGDAGVEPSPAASAPAQATATSTPVTKATAAAAPATITVSATPAGTTPVALGYNSAHAMAGSNARDWWRYSGVKAARVFVSASDIEPVDDIAGVGDGVSSRETFDARRLALRTNAADPAVPLDPRFVNWSAFEAAYDSVADGNNRFAVNRWFPELRALGVDILVNVTASPSRFPLAGATDHANAWELWQHYYAQAYKLARDFDVRRFSMFNEPNGWTPAIAVEDWALRLRICSDAIQSAIADVNARHGRALVAEVLAPNTANGATKYDEPSDSWGRAAVTQRALDPWGGARASGTNLHVYNYQKYDMSAEDYAADFDLLASKVSADMGGAPFPFALTEFNVRTGASYDGRVETGDSPSDYAALGANAVTLAARGVSQLYLFKFGMTARSASSVYPVAKNGTHYVNNAGTGLNEYGGAAATAEVWRLFVRASGSGRERLAFQSTLGAEVFVQATRDGASRTRHVFIANRGLVAVPVEIDVAALGVAESSLVTVEEVGQAHRGGVARVTAIQGGRVPAASMPAQSVWLVSIHDGTSGTPTAVTASADAMLTDGRGRTTAGGTANPMVVRGDGTTGGRRVAVMRFAVPTSWTPGQRVLLSLNVATTSGSAPIQAHVYGLESDAWSESSLTFSTLVPALEQNVPAGNLIANNVVGSPLTTTKILGQLVASSATGTEKLLDVTDFVTAQTDGAASFLVVQDHRWDVKLPEKTAGDTQSAGLAIVSREGTNRPALKLHAPAPPPVAPAIVTAPASRTAVQGTSTSFSVVASGTGPLAYQWRRDGSPIAGAQADTLVLPSVALADAGTYSVVVTNAQGSATSAGAVLTVTQPPPPPSVIAAEFDGLVVVGSSGDTIDTLTDAQASGGRSLRLRSNARGDHVTLALPVPTPGSYSIAISAKMGSDRGIFQLATARAPGGPYTDIDTRKDEYRAATTFGSVGPFATRLTVATAGTVYLRFTVTGKNRASTGYVLSLDAITLTP